MGDLYEAVIHIYTQSADAAALTLSGIVRLTYGDGYEALSECWQSAAKFASLLQERGAGDAFLHTCQAIK